MDVKGRNPVAYALALRGKGGTMKDRRAPKGGQRNTQAELLEEALEELQEDERNG
jgi:hypothetical protein